MNVYRLWCDDAANACSFTLFVRASYSHDAENWAKKRGFHVCSWEVSNGEGRRPDTPIFSAWL